MNYSIENIKANLCKLTARQKMTNERLAELANVNYNTIIKLKNGSNKNPTVKTMIGICNALGVSIQTILSDENL